MTPDARTKIRNLRAEVRHLNRALRIAQLSQTALIASRQDAWHELATFKRHMAEQLRHGGPLGAFRAWYRFRQGETYPAEYGVRYLRWLPRWRGWPNRRRAS